VLARGGSVHSIPFEHERSTTRLLARIRGPAGRGQPGA
jgi:bifunctional ADP-heptose synthase (sugar kinase/adenylyltransferase)